MSVIFFALIPLFGVGVFLLLNKKKKGTSRDSVVKPPRGGWVIAYSPGMPSEPSKTANGMFEFTFPHQEGGPDRDLPSVHYVYKAAGDLTKATKIRMVGRLEGEGELDAAHGGGLPCIFLWFQREDDDFSTTKYEAGYRWWSIPSMRLTTFGQDMVLEAPLDDHTEWSGGAKGNVEAFKKAIVEAAHVGFTCGGGGGKGHGVYAKSGGVKFVLKEFSIT